jgi:hypothetical protein
LKLLILTQYSGYCWQVKKISDAYRKKTTKAFIPITTPNFAPPTPCFNVHENNFVPFSRSAIKKLFLLLLNQNPARIGNVQQLASGGKLDKNSLITH